MFTFMIFIMSKKYDIGYILVDKNNYYNDDFKLKIEKGKTYTLSGWNFESSGFRVSIKPYYLDLSSLNDNINIKAYEVNVLERGNRGITSIKVIRELSWGEVSDMCERETPDGDLKLYEYNKFVSNNKIIHKHHIKEITHFRRWYRNIVAEYEDGKLIELDSELLTYNESNERVHKNRTTFSYDDNGKLSEKTMKHTSYGGESLISDYVIIDKFSYDKNDNIIHNNKRYIMNNPSVHDTYYKYDKDNRLIKEIEKKHVDNELVNTDVTEYKYYDDKCDVIRNTRLLKTHTYEYKDDIKIETTNYIDLRCNTLIKHYDKNNNLIYVKDDLYESWYGSDGNIIKKVNLIVGDGFEISIN